MAQMFAVCLGVQRKQSKNEVSVIEARWWSDGIQPNLQDTCSCLKGHSPAALQRPTTNHEGPELFSR